MMRSWVQTPSLAFYNMDSPIDKLIKDNSPIVWSESGTKLIPLYKKRRVGLFGTDLVVVGYITLSDDYGPYSYIKDLLSGTQRLVIEENE